MMDAVGTPSSVLVLGGTSDIGLAVVERLGTGTRLRVVLAARPSARRDEAVRRLTGAGHEASVVGFDAEDTGSHAGTVEQAFAGGDLDVVVVAGGGHALRRRVPSRRRSCGEHHPQPGARTQPLHHRQADVGGPAHDEHRRGRADGVHHSASLLARSDVNTCSGSTRSRTAHHSSSLGYMRRTASGAIRASLAR